jgi:hypothetical protein
MSETSATREDGTPDPSRFSRKPRESRANNEIRFTRCGWSAMARVFEGKTIMGRRRSGWLSREQDGQVSRLVVELAQDL